LYYRLQANVLQILPLRERLDDVPLLVDHFIALFDQRLGRTIVTEGIDRPALDAMSRYQWPGNVRELANAVEGAMTFGTEPLIRLEDLPPSISRLEMQKPLWPAVPQAPGGVGTLAEVERNLILRALEACKWNKVHAAAMLKISRKKLYAKINKYQLEPSSGRSEEE
jgi:DNA-binding NtrC family response regulator